MSPVVNGDWWRWSQYDLVDGVVVPASGARLSFYDPWASFRAHAGIYRTVSQPYLACLELARVLRDLDARGIRPTQFHGRNMTGRIVGPSTAADGRIVEWCNTHGHLGIVPVLSTSIRLDDVADRAESAIQRTHYVRDVDRWHLDTASQFEWQSTREATDEHLRNSATKTTGTVTWFNFETRVHDARPLDTLRDYFSRRGAASDPVVPPRPLTDEFWHAYDEPVWEIGRYCHLFGQAVDYLTQWNDALPSDQQDPTVRRASMVLEDLARNVALNDVDNTRTSAGLLASYALMFLWDRTEGRRCLQCEHCNHYFVSNARQARYCTPRCRNVTQSRRHRAKKRGTKGPEGSQ